MTVTLTFDAAYRRILTVKNAPKEGVERTATLLAGLGDPHRTFRSVHVAGTNGKGSTVAFCDAVLRREGVRCGRHISPHLMHVSERIAVNGVDIDDASFCRFEAAIHEVAATMADPPTFFERMFVMACLHFRAQNVDVAVVEVGLGGRLDATNVIVPQVSVLAPIALDHTRFLGPDVATIAGEKAAIIKPGVPAVSAQQVPQAQAVITRRAAAVGTPLWVVGRDVRGVSGPGEGVRVTDAAGRVWAEAPSLGLAGAHQIQNAALAVGALVAAGYAPDAGRWGSALQTVSWPGRYEVLESSGPRLVVDGAHNPHAAGALAALLQTRPVGGKRVFVVGATTGHESQPFAAALAAQSSHVVATMSSAPRSVPAAEVAHGFRAAGYADVIEADMPAALEAARRTAGPTGEVVVTGSLYLVGEVRRRLRGGREDPMVQGF